MLILSDLKFFEFYLIENSLKFNSRLLSTLKLNIYKITCFLSLVKVAIIFLIHTISIHSDDDKTRMPLKKLTLKILN